MTPCRTIGHSELAEIQEGGRLTPVSTSTSQSGLCLREVRVKAAGRGRLPELWAAASWTRVKGLGKVTGLGGARQQSGVSGSPPNRSPGLGWNLALIRSIP